MTYSRRSPSGGTAFYDSASDVSPLTPFRLKYRPLIEVPTGTVASRILELQNLASNFSRPKNLLSPQTAHPYHCRSGYGRRKDARFGNPASRSTNPDGSDTTHSFLALRSYRASHMEEHALTDGLTKWQRSSGINGQLHPQGMSARVQYEATSPAGILPKSNFQDEDQNFISVMQSKQVQDEVTSPVGISLESKSPKNTLSLCKQKDRGTLRSSKSVILLNAAMAPSSPAGYYLGRKSPIRNELSSRSRFGNKCPHQNRSRERSTVNSTLSERKQSVKDLYQEYGIDRPPGLVSESDDTLRHGQSEMLFEKRPSYEFQLGHSKHQIHYERREVVSESQLYQNEDHSRPTRMASNFFPKRPVPTRKPIMGPHPTQKPSSSRNPSKNDQTSNTIRKLPSELQQSPHLRSDHAALWHGSRKPPPSHIEMPSRKPTQRPSSSNCNEERKDVGAITTDKQSGLHTVKLFPMLVPFSAHEVHYGYDQHHSGSHHHDDRCSTSASESEQQSASDKYCGSSGCRATHSGHRPYRHSISCTKRRQSSFGEAEYSSSAEEKASHFQEQKPNKWKCKNDAQDEDRQDDQGRVKPQDPSPPTSRESPWPEQSANTHCTKLDFKSNRNLDRIGSASTERILDSVSPSFVNRGQQGQPPTVTVIIQPPTRYETGVPQGAKSRKITVVETKESLKEGRRRSGVKLERKSICSSKSRHRIKDPTTANPPASFTRLSSSPSPFRENHIGTLPLNNSSTAQAGQLDHLTITQCPTVSPIPRLLSHSKSTNVLSDDAVVRSSLERSSTLSRRLSAFFKIQRKNSVSVLNKHRQAQQDGSQHPENAGNTSKARVKKGEEPRGMLEMEQRMRHWKLKLSGKQPRCGSGNDYLISQHELADDETIESFSMEPPQHAVADCMRETLREEEQQIERTKSDRIGEEKANHDCAWKRMVLENSNHPITGASTTSSPGKDDIGILGISVVIHMEGRDDMVLRAHLDDQA